MKEKYKCTLIDKQGNQVVRSIKASALDAAKEYFEKQGYQVVAITVVEDYQSVDSSFTNPVFSKKENAVKSKIKLEKTSGENWFWRQLWSNYVRILNPKAVLDSDIYKYESEDFPALATAIRYSAFVIKVQLKVVNSFFGFCLLIPL